MTIMVMMMMMIMMVAVMMTMTSNSKKPQTNTNVFRKDTVSKRCLKTTAQYQYSGQQQQQLQ